MLAITHSLCAETSLYIHVWISTKLRSQCASVYTPATALSVDSLDTDVGRLFFLHLGLWEFF